jgi:hypothetical protein
MRLSPTLRLAALCLIAGSIVASGSPLFAQRHPPQPVKGPPPAKPVEPKKPLIKKEFKGWGTNVSTAQSDALNQACKWLADESNLGWPSSEDLNDEQKRDKVFEATAEFLKQKNMVHFGEAEDTTTESTGPMKLVKMDLEITEPQARDIQKQAQQVRMKSRQGISLLVVIGVVCLLAVIGGYLRLEEATKGYYTRLLRVAAIGLVILVVLSLFVIA